MITDATSMLLQSFVLTDCSYDEFRRKAFLVPVIAARGKSGYAKTGPLRWMCRDNYEEPDALGALRNFLLVCLSRRQGVLGESMTDQEKKEWMAKSVATFLDPKVVSLDGAGYYTVGPDNHTLIIYRDDIGPLVGVSRETIIGLIWHVDQDRVSEK